MSQRSLSEEVRFRVPLPFVIPLLSLLVIGLVTIGLSRILLSVPKEAAVIIALAVAANVLIAGAVIANRPETARNSWAELLIVFTYPVVVGVVLAQMNIAGGEHAAAEESGAQALAEAEGGGPGLNIAAQNLEFSSDTITLPAGEETTLGFENEDASSIQHNVAIYEEEGGKDLFIGEVIPGGGAVSYDVPALEKGKYYFQCDLHPGMNGTVTVE